MVQLRLRSIWLTVALVALLLLGYYSVREPPATPISSVAAKIAGAKERLQQSTEEQNRGLKQALEAARASLKQAPETPAATSEPAPIEGEHKETNGRDRFAYVFYATNDNYACSVLVNIHRLKKLLHTALAIHVIATLEVSEDVLQAIRAAGATLHIQPTPPLPDTAVQYYRDSLLKLRAFQMHKLSPGLTRVLAFDADQLVMKNMDHLFTDLPDVDLAAPRAYWLSKDWLSSTFMLISLSDRLWTTMEQAMNKNLLNVEDIRYDMDLVNDVLGDTVMMLSGEYVCLNSHFEDWNLPHWYHAERALNWTTIQMINDLVKPPQPLYDSSPGSRKHKRQLFTHTDIAPEVLPTAAPRIQQPPPPQQIDASFMPLVPMTPSSAYTPLPDPILPPLEAVSPSPRFPINHPLALELARLQDTAAVIHFSAVGKPWSYGPDTVEQSRPDAHPLLAEQFKIWRDTANEVCPGGAAARAAMPQSLEVAMPAPESTSWYVTPLSGVGMPVSTTR